MAKPKRNRLREERIHNEVTVDPYGPEEQALGWYYYLRDRQRSKKRRSLDAGQFVVSHCRCKIGGSLTELELRSVTRNQKPSIPAQQAAEWAAMEAGFPVVARGPQGEIRAIESPVPDFYIATLF